MNLLESLLRTLKFLVQVLCHTVRHIISIERWFEVEIGAVRTWWSGALIEKWSL